MAGHRTNATRRKKPVSLWIITLEGVLLGLAGIVGILSVDRLVSPGLGPASDGGVVIGIDGCATLAGVSGCAPSTSH